MRKAVVVSTFSTLIWLAPSLAHAACDEAVQTQSEMNICAGRDFERADQELNAVYKKLKRTEKLVAAQKAWLAYRDADCAFAHRASPEGTMYGMETMLCKTARTKERISVLSEYVGADLD